jgi:HlyD family secretion protein
MTRGQRRAPAHRRSHRGTLVRDASVNGRVVAAVSPTLYAASSTVNLKVAAGDTVKKGEVLAVLESPDLSDALKREQSRPTNS